MQAACGDDAAAAQQLQEQFDQEQVDARAAEEAASAALAVELSAAPGPARTGNTTDLFKLYSQAVRDAGSKPLDKLVSLFQVSSRP